jgi:hypothetical protein
VGTRLRGHDFNLRNTAGFVFGPVSYENLVNLVQTGSVSEEEFVSIDGGAWKKVKEVTQIRTLSPNEAMRIKGIAPTYSGIVSRVAIPKIFYQVASRQISGKLRFSSGSSQKEFYFSRGKPKHIASNLKQELLGPFLLHRGVVNNDQMSQALRKSGDFGGRVGDALVSLGFVRPHELYFLLDEQFKEKLIQVFEWQQGSYEFYDRAPCPVEMAPSDVNVYRYILEGVRRYLKLPELTPFLATHEQNVIRERKNLFLAVDHLPLNSREQRLWGLVQRKPVLQAVRDEFCAREEDRLSLYQLLLVLFQLDLIEFVRKK